MSEPPADSAHPLANAAETRGAPLRRVAELTALMGIAHAVLFLLSFWLLTRSPGPRATDAELVAFYTSDNLRRLSIVGLTLMPFAGIAFMWFVVSLRMWISGSILHEKSLPTNIQFVSGILFVALFFAAAAAISVTAASVQFADAPVDPMVARLFPQYGRTLFFFFALRMAAMFVFTTSTIHMGAAILPRWYGLAGFAVGVVLLLTPTFNDWFVLVFPAWVLAMAALLLVEARRLPAAPGAAPTSPVTAAPGDPAAKGST